MKLVIRGDEDDTEGDARGVIFSRFSCELEAGVLLGFSLFSSLDRGVE